MMPILHEFAQSGNCYKIRLTAAHAGIALERREYDILKGETRTPQFLSSVSPNGRIPVLQIGDRFLPESGAACFWIATGTPLIPQDRFDRADMLRWMFWEQYHPEPNIGTLRFWRAFLGEGALTPAQCEQIAGKEAAGHAALTLINDHLATRRFFVADGFTLADIAVYGYIHVADEAGFDLSQYPKVTEWLARVARQPGHIAITA
ncbi:glutathione S-transferase family protein [soil metagenome]